MSFTTELDELKLHISSVIPSEASALVDDFIREMKENGIENRAIKVGQEIPAFSLPNAVGKTVSSTELLLRGPLVVTFYRGSWCPFCNLYLKSLRDMIPAFNEVGAQLVAISGMTPDNSLSFQEKLDLGFEVLSDKGLAVADRFGLVYDLNGQIRDLFALGGMDYKNMYGNESFRMTMPATYVTDHDGIVIAEVDMDWRNRLDPLQILAALQKLT